MKLTLHMEICGKKTSEMGALIKQFIDIDYHLAFYVKIVSYSFSFGLTIIIGSGILLIFTCKQRVIRPKS